MKQHEMKPYNTNITREQFLFYEMRVTAGLLRLGNNRQEALQKIVAENLFQYPTEKSLRPMALACFKRLDALGDDSAINMVAAQSYDVVKQLCLYAMMRQYSLVWDFMITVIGEKYRTLDTTFGKLICLGTLQDCKSRMTKWQPGVIPQLPN